MKFKILLFAAFLATPALGVELFDGRTNEAAGVLDIASDKFLFSDVSAAAGSRIKNITGATLITDLNLVTAAAAFGTDNRLLRSDGTGKGTQSTGITVGDTDAMSGIASMAVSGALSAGALEFEGATADFFETSLAVVDPTADRTITFPNATGTVILSSDLGAGVQTALSATANAPGGVVTAGQSVDVFVIAISDETTALATGTDKVTFRAPYSFTVTGVKASLTTVSSSGLPTFDINETGVTIMAVTKLTVDASEKTSTTAVTAAVVSDTAIANDAEITIDIDVAGTGAAGGKIYITHTH